MFSTNRRARSRSSSFGAVASVVFAALASALVSLPAFAGEAPDGKRSLPEISTPTGAFLAGEVANDDGDVYAAAMFYARAAAIEPSDLMLATRAFALSLTTGEFQQALDLGHHISELNPKDHAPALAFAVNAFARGDHRAVAAFTESPGTGDLDRLSAIMLGAWNRAAGGDIDAALRRLPVRAADQWVAFFNTYQRGLMEDMVGRSFAAVQDLRTAAGFDSSSPRVIEALVRALYRAGQKDEAFDLVGRALGKAPKSPPMNALLAEMKAGGKLRPLVTSPREGAAEYFLAIGQALERNGAGEQAAIMLQLSLVLAPGNDLAHLDLSENYEKTQQFLAANRQLAAIDSTSPFTHAANIQIALNLDRAGMFDEAVAKLRSLQTAGSDDFEARQALGDLYRIHAKFDLALPEYDKAIALKPGNSPENWELYYDRGICLQELKRWPEAERDFKQALDLAPDQPEVLNYLAYSWIDRGEHFDEALPMLIKAVKAAPDDGFIVDSLGWNYYKLGRIDDAVKTMEHAVDLKTGDPQVNDHLGDVYWRAGRHLEARYQWRKAIDLKPTEPGELEALQKKVQDGLADDAKPDGGKPIADKPAAPPAATLEAAKPTGDGKPATQ